eukprot:TRINITY_DN7335_c0_g1_i1.p1 TRINITY_DN7335_c0_g1~~TRINITY_DN7335_c0_g1_i1.p1  ORF type:complete len:414 (-),score=102.72 TRINITY_DN7335_c0_g1_i1:109-1194(-)
MEDRPDEDMDDTNPDAEPEEGDGDIVNDSINAFFEHTDSVYTVDINPTLPNMVATGGGDDKAYIWDINSSAVAFSLEGHKDSITQTKFSVDGKYLATACADGSVGIWDTATGKVVQMLEGPTAEIEFVDWHPKGNIILAGSRDATGWMWLAKTGECMKVFAGHSDAVTAGGFSEDGKTVLTASEDATLRVWDPKTGAPGYTFQGHEFHSEAIHCFATKENFVLTGGQDNTARLANYATGKILGTLPGHSDAVETVAFSHSQGLAATGSLDKKINIWDLTRMNLRGTLEHDDGVIKLVWHPSDLLIYSCSMDGTIRLWDGRNGRCERTWKGHKDIVLDFALSKDGNTIVSGSDDHASYIFQV